MSKVLRLLSIVESTSSEYSPYTLQQMDGEYFQYDPEEQLFKYNDAETLANYTINDIISKVSKHMEKTIRGYKIDMFQHDGEIYCSLTSKFEWVITCEMPKSFMFHADRDAALYGEEAYSYLKHSFDITPSDDTPNLSIRYEQSHTRQKEDPLVDIEIIFSSPNYITIDEMKSYVKKIHSKTDAIYILAVKKCVHHGITYRDVVIEMYDNSIRLEISSSIAGANI